MLKAIITGCGILGLSIVLQAQNKLYINFKAGSLTTHSLENVKSITFPGSAIKVNKVNGASEITPIISIGFLKFDVVTGLLRNEAVNTNNINIYPNPLLDNKVTVNYNLPGSGQVLIEIVDMNGLVRNSFSEAGRAGINQVQLVLSDLAAGIYLCKVKAGEQVLSTKIIKN